MIKKINFIFCFVLSTLDVFGMQSDFQAFQSRTIEGGNINSCTLFYCDVYLKGGVQPKINSSNLIGVEFYNVDDAGNKKKCNIHTSHSSLIIGKTGVHAFCLGILLLGISLGKMLR